MSQPDIEAYLPGDNLPTDLEGYTDYVMVQFVMDHLAHRHSPNLPDHFEFDPGRPQKYRSN